MEMEMTTLSIKRQSIASARLSAPDSQWIIDTLTDKYLGVAVTILCSTVEGNCFAALAEPSL